MARKFKWECKVLTDVFITHSAGGTVTKNFTLLRSYIDMESAIYVAKQYLNFNSGQLLMLGIFRWFELCIRQLIKAYHKHKRLKLS